MISSRALVLFTAVATMPAFGQLTITNPSPLPTGVATVPYSTTLTTTGAVGSTFWQTSGALPPGISLDSTTGLLAGTTTSPGLYNFTVTASDNSEASVQKPFALRINTLISISTNFLQGQVGVPFQGAISATGGENNGPYTFALVNSTLPPGLTMNAQTGAITGTPQAPPNFYTIQVTATDAASPPQTSPPATVFIDILPPPLMITTTTPLPRAVRTVAYMQNLQAAGGFPPYAWSVATGSSLPPGLALSPAGALAGTPTQAGSFTFTAEVRDTDEVPTTVTRTFALTVVEPLVITTATPLPSGTQNVAYSQTLAATGGVAPRTGWTVISGSLPPGLTLNSSTGALTGTPTSAGAFTFTVQVRDSDTVQQTASKQFSLSIAFPPIVITTASPLTGGTLGTPLSQLFSATGGSGTYTWSIADGALPPGVTLNPATGVATGTPAGVGTYVFTVEATDTAQASARKQFSLDIQSNLVITTASPLPPGTVGAPYSQVLSASGGTPPYGFQVLSGSLPPGIRLTGNTLAGTPTAAGTYNFVIRVLDSTPTLTTFRTSKSGGAREASSPAALIADKAFVLQINLPPVTITTPSPLPPGGPGAPYSLAFAATGGSPPYTWSLASAALPLGLTLSPAGLLSGDLLQIGQISFAVRVTDSQNQSAVKEFVLVTETRRTPLEIATTSLPDGTIGVPYGAIVTARGGTPAYTFSFAGLPPGLQGDARGGIVGTPTTAGDYTVRVSASDEERGQVSATFTITIKPGTVEVTTASVPEGRIGAAYSAAFAARGGVPPYTWTLGGGTLPSGLALGTGGDLSGTPAQPGTFTFTVQATDTQRSSGTKSFTLIVRTGTLQITTELLPNGTANFPYSASLAATGGVTPYKWSLSGSVPPGLSLNGDTGEISGTPTAPGTYSLSARVADAGNASAEKAFTITIAPPLVITTASPLPSLTVNTPGGASFAATGGVTPYTWSTTGGNVPPGTTFAAGQLTGTPTLTGTFGFTVQVADANRATATKSFTIDVVSNLTITTETLAAATVGSAYSASVSAAGGLAPYFWSATGSLPPGVSISESGGIAGQPTAAGSFAFTVQVRDSAQPNAATSSRSFTIVVGLPQLTSVNVSGLPDNPTPAQQPRIALSIGAPYPVDVAGTVTLTFTPDATNNADDPAIQFSTGGRTATFTIPAGQTQAAFRAADVLVQTGTVAGTITLTTTLTAGGNPVTCDCPLVRTLRIPRSAPVITNVRVTRTGNGFNLVITGYSSTREITRGVFRFSGTIRLQTNEVIVPFTDVFNSYFRASSQVGGQFVLTMPFVIQGEVGAVTSVSVILSNTQGDSQAVSSSL